MNATRRDFLFQLGASIAALGGLAPRHSAAMMPRDLSNLSAVQAAGAMRRGDITAEQDAQCCLLRAEALKDVNAFITLNPEAVLEAPRKADRRRVSGAALGALHGLPLAVKDNIDTVGVPTTAGTPALRAHRPRADAPLMTALYGAGALLLGKTNLHELAFGYTTNNGAFGAARNPYDQSRIPGGSSGGTGAAARRWRWLPASHRPGSAPTRWARCASPAPCAASRGCGRALAAILAPASCRCLTHVTRRVRWRDRSPIWFCSTASSRPMRRRWSRCP